MQVAKDMDNYFEKKSKKEETPNEGTSINVECPHCNYDNTIKLKNPYTCNNCDKSIIEQTKTYKTNKSKLIATAIISAVGSAVLADQYIDANEIIAMVGTGGGTMIYMSRLTIETEYKIMKTCIDEFGSNTQTRDSCFCVVKKLNNYLNPVIAKIKGEEWLLDQLNTQYKKCSPKEEEAKSLPNQTKS